MGSNPHRIELLGAPLAVRLEPPSQSIKRENDTLCGRRGDATCSGQVIRHSLDQGIRVENQTNPVT